MNTTILVLIAVPLYLACTVVLGVGAYLWCRAILGVESVKHHKRESALLDMAEDVSRDARRAATLPVAPIQSDLPDDDELNEAILAERMARGGVITTDENNGIQGDIPPIPRGGLFATSGR